MSLLVVNMPSDKNLFCNGVFFMKPLKRKRVSKSKSSKKFRRDSSRTKAVNLKPMPMRGGIRA